MIVFDAFGKALAVGVTIKTLSSKRYLWTAPGLVSGEVVSFGEAFVRFKNGSKVHTRRPSRVRVVAA